jgi:hypothetical protein
LFFEDIRLKNQAAIFQQLIELNDKKVALMEEFEKEVGKP